MCTMQSVPEDRADRLVTLYYFVLIWLIAKGDLIVLK